MTVVDFEEERELVAFGRRMRAELAPVGELELALADRLVSLAWRIRRLTGIEGELLEAGNSDRQPGCAFGGYAGEKLLRLNRYETTLDRQFYRTLHELQRLQATLRGEAVPMPEAVDVTVSVAADTAHHGREGVGSFRQNRGAEIKLVNGHAPATTARADPLRRQHGRPRQRDGDARLPRERSADALPGAPGVDRASVRRPALVVPVPASEEGRRAASPRRQAPPSPWRALLRQPGSLRPHVSLDP
jgi:hypothetical protein